MSYSLCSNLIMLVEFSPHSAETVGGKAACICYRRSSLVSHRIGAVRRGCRQDGAFQVYRGIPPESTFYRVKQYLLRLEGVFRLLPPDLNTEKR